MVEAGMVRCARCGERILPGEAWDLGHLDGTERTLYSGPEHRRCNRTTEAHKRQRYHRASGRSVGSLPERLRKGGGGLLVPDEELRTVCRKHNGAEVRGREGQGRRMVE
jgi:hypothetical protein